MKAVGVTARLSSASINAPLYARKLGFLGMVTFAFVPLFVGWFARRFGLTANNIYLPVLIREYANVVWMRFDTSDYQVLRQIFVVEEFAAIASEVDDPRFIVDCGANAGYASVYFLRRFPSAHVTAIEPERGNVQLCAENLRAFPHRTKIIEAGVWSDDTGLVVEKGIHADGRDWATRVRAMNAGETAQVRGISLGTVLRESGFEAIDLLKVDIENAERIVFGANFEHWLPRVRNIAIELHDEDCERAFFAALTGYEYRLTRQGNLTICTGLRRTIA